MSAKANYDHLTVVAATHSLTGALETKACKHTVVEYQQHVRLNDSIGTSFDIAVVHM